MKVAYFDCMSGISGDMTLGALVDAGVDFDSLNEAICSLGLPGCHLERETVKRHGFHATKIHVRHEPEHAHRHLHHIHEIIERSKLTDSQQELAKKIFQRLAEAEAKVHGSTLEKVHFHEVGAVDSIADILGVAVGLELLQVDEIHCSPVPTGCGSIQIAHGRVNVPAPATAELLRGIPLAKSDVPFELTTPTGAAILAATVSQVGSLPAMAIENIGYGAGQRELEKQANVLRLVVLNDKPTKMLGNSGTVSQAVEEEQGTWVAESNIDDCSPELLGHVVDRLWKAGALDVTCTSIQMKKSRPGTKLTVVAKAPSLAQVEEALFQETTTLGIRKWPVSRVVLKRKQDSIETTWGTLQVQRVARPGLGETLEPEYESCRQLAEKHKIPLRRVFESVNRFCVDNPSSNSESTG